jgi:adenylate cyclase
MNRPQVSCGVPVANTEFLPLEDQTLEALDRLMRTGSAARKTELFVTLATYSGMTLVNGLPSDSVAVQRQLERVLSSGGFRKCPQLVRFLRFAVGQALAGSDGASKETLIGIEIFGRRPDYDPGSDPVVRVEARRLRDKLAQYYRTEGRADPIRIHMPKGGYFPVFEVQPVVPAPSAEAPEARSIAVLPFADRSSNHALEALADGLTARLIAKLAACAGLRMVSSTSVFQFKNRSEDARRIGEELNAVLLLEGSVRRAGKWFRCDTQLISVADGLHLWAGSFDCARRSAFAIEDEFAERIAEGVRISTG